MVDRKNAGLLVVLRKDAFAAVGKESVDSGITGKWRAAVAVDTLEILRSPLIVRRETPGRVDLTFIEHPVERLVLSQPVQRDTRRSVFIQAKQHAVTHVLGSADVPMHISMFD